MKEAAELFTLTLNEEKAADKKLSLLAKSINVKAKAEKPPASVKTAVKKSAKLPVKIPSAGQREVQGIESNMERNRVSRNESLMVDLNAEKEHSPRSRRNGRAYLRGHVTTPREASNFVARVPGLGGCARES